MLIKTKAIVLSRIKYKDSDLIVKCYTEKKGITNYLIKGALKQKKGGSKIAYFQYLSQLILEENYRSNRNFQFINEIKIDYPYTSLHTIMPKTAIAIFLSEVLSEVLKEEEENKNLYNYIEASLKWLDLQNNFSNFHLLFLLNLTKYLGFFPDVSRIQESYFNLSNGRFESFKSELYNVSNDNLKTLKALLGINFEDLENVKLSSKQRQSFLTMLLLYFELHLGHFKKPKSIHVFNQVFH